MVGVFLIGDLFNFFVFFEVLLIVFYGLLLYGGGVVCMWVGLYYVVFNLFGLIVFLFVVGLIYVLLGSFNLVDFVVKVVVLLLDNFGLVWVGGLLLFVVFGFKVVLLLFYLWLLVVYVSMMVLVVVLFVIMIKVGIYVILCVDILFFSDVSGVLGGLFVFWLLLLVFVIVGIGMFGVLVVECLGRFVVYFVVVLVGILLIVFVLGMVGIVVGFYYLLYSIFSVVLLFLLVEVVKWCCLVNIDFFKLDVDMLCYVLWGGLFFVVVIVVGGLLLFFGFFGKFLILCVVLEYLWVWFVILFVVLVGLIVLVCVGSWLFFNVKSVDFLLVFVMVLLVVDELYLVVCELVVIVGLLGLIFVLMLVVGLVVDFICVVVG